MSLENAKSRQKFASFTRAKIRDFCTKGIGYINVENVLVNTLT